MIKIRKMRKNNDKTENTTKKKMQSKHLLHRRIYDRRL